MPDADGAKAHVKIAEADPEQTQPRPKHVAAVQARNTAVTLEGSRRARKLIAKPAHEMTQGMTPKGVATKQNDVDREHERADSNPEAIGVVAALLIVAVIATCLPARAATRLDPNSVLRTE